MKLLKAFQSTGKAEDYHRHRNLMRFVFAAGEGIQRVAEHQVQRFIDANRAIGAKLDDTLVHGFDRMEFQQKEIHGALLQQTEVIQKSLFEIELSLEQGFDQVAEGMEQIGAEVRNVNDTLVQTGEMLEEGLAGLKASVDMGMMSIVSQFELQRVEMQEGLKQLSSLIENSKKTEARERFLDGKNDFERFLQHPDEPRFLKDAHDYLQESVKVYRGNPFCHLYLGHVFQEAGLFFDLEKSREHYLACATYAKGIDNPHLTAEGYFLAAWISYVLGEFENATDYGEKVLEYDPEGLPENYYNLAKYYARRKDPQSAIRHLAHAVRSFDPFYTLKADMDADFQAIRPQLDQLFVDLRDEAAGDWDQHLKRLQE